MPRDTEPGLRAGSSAYRRAALALVCAGLATFNALYTTQALLPRIVTEFHVSIATAALTVSAATASLALCVVPAAILSERYGRGKTLIISVLAATSIGLVVPLAPTIEVLIALRALQGAFIAGVPAAAMTWISEEIHLRDISTTVGLYIAGTSVGGITGRLIPTLALGVTDWRWSILISSGCALLLAITTALVLPAQRGFTPTRLNVKNNTIAALALWRQVPLAVLFCCSFILMGVFVSLFNVIGFRLIDDFGFHESHVGLLFLLYLAGTYTSARAGRIITRFGHGATLIAGSIAMVLGVALCADTEPFLGCGLLLFIAAFFLMHSTASAAISQRATTNTAQASGMYVLMYYLGSSVLGWASGYVYDVTGWYGFLIWLTGWLVLLIVLIMVVNHHMKQGDAP